MIYDISLSVFLTCIIVMAFVLLWIFLLSDEVFDAKTANILNFVLGSVWVVLPTVALLSAIIAVWSR